MSANQYGVETIWLLVIINMFAVVLHYSVTLQFSAYFHIYFNISRKYETKIHTTHLHLKEKAVSTKWLQGIFKSPFTDDQDDEEDD